MLAFNGQRKGWRCSYHLCPYVGLRTRVSTRLDSTVYALHYYSWKQRSDTQRSGIGRIRTAEAGCLSRDVKRNSRITTDFCPTDAG